MPKIKDLGINAFPLMMQPPSGGEKEGDPVLWTGSSFCTHITAWSGPIRCGEKVWSGPARCGEKVWTGPARCAETVWTGPARCAEDVWTGPVRCAETIWTGPKCPAEDWTGAKCTVEAWTGAPCRAEAWTGPKCAAGPDSEGWTGESDCGHRESDDKPSSAAGFTPEAIAHLRQQIASQSATV